MINSTFNDAFSAEWVDSNITDYANELIILREIIPWQKIITHLTPYYSKNSGAIGISLRIMVAVLFIKHFRQLSDRTVIKYIQENRYLQYFCNIPDGELYTFMDHSSLFYFRQRLGIEGIAIIEEHIFDCLRIAEVIKGDEMLMDSTTLDSHILYPNDIHLIYNAFEKFKQFASVHSIAIWWDEPIIKELWRHFNLDKKKAIKRAEWLKQFYALFVPAFNLFKTKLEQLNTSTKRQEKAQQLLNTLTILDQQTVQKLKGEIHIKNRLVSLKEVDARPIKKGKSHPDCEFGTTLQMTFNRQGFLVTVENFIGHPNDKILYASSLELFIKRLHETPNIAVTDLGYRSAKNLSIKPEGLEHCFMGRTSDVVEEQRDFCCRARSATEGYIAVAKNLRGFGRSLYLGLKGDNIWTLLCQISYNLKKFLQLYLSDNIEEDSLIKLGI